MTKAKTRPKDRTTIPRPRQGAFGEWDRFLAEFVSGRGQLLGHGAPRGLRNALRRRRRRFRG